MDGPMQAQSSVHRYCVRHFGISSSSFRWRLCCWERHRLKSSASCGPFSLVVDPTGADIQTNHQYIQGPTARKAPQAEPTILPQLVTSARIFYQPHHQQHDQTKKKHGGTEVLYHVTPYLTYIAIALSSAFYMVGTSNLGS